jgi:hypothetical protein
VPVDACVWYYDIYVYALFFKHVCVNLQTHVTQAPSKPSKVSLSQVVFRYCCTTCKPALSPGIALGLRAGGTYFGLMAAHGGRFLIATVDHQHAHIPNDFSAYPNQLSRESDSRNCRAVEAEFPTGDGDDKTERYELDDEADHGF